MINGTSMFKMEDANAVLKMELVGAKKYLLAIVNESSANRANIAMATRAIQSANNTRKLSSLVANFILAHPENNLKSL